MGQQLSAAGAEGQHGDRCTTGINGAAMETSISVTAWRRAQQQSTRELELENSRMSGEPGNGNGEMGVKSASPGNPGKRSSSSIRSTSRNYSGSGSVGGGGGSSENSCGSGDGSIEIGSGRNSSNSAESDIGRMSVRAAIDSFIENCLSARSDPPTGPQVNLSSITGIIHNSQEKNNVCKNESKTQDNRNNSKNSVNKKESCDSKVNSDKNASGEDEVKSNCDDDKNDKKENSDDGDEKKGEKEGEDVEKKNVLSSKEKDSLKDEDGCSKSDQKMDSSDGNVDKCDNKNTSNSNAIGNRDDGERLNENDPGLVIDCDQDNSTDNNSSDKNSKGSKDTNKPSPSNTENDSFENKGRLPRQPPLPTDSPHVIDVDSEDFPSPPGVLFPNGRKVTPTSKSSKNSDINSSFENYKRHLEKKTFSDFLQDRLMAQIESNELQSNGSSNVLTWEVSNSSSTSNNPPTLSVPGKGSSLSSATTAGPVRLQTLIDKVLDQSLNKDSRPLNAANSKSIPMQPTAATAAALPNATGSSSSTSSVLPPSAKGHSNKHEGSTRLKINTMCFKDHIEKVLEENFRSYEEDGDDLQSSVKDYSHISKDDKKSESENPTSPDVEIIKYSSKEFSNQKSSKKMENSTGNASSGRVGPDGTISVQDIVDRVISQTEVISKLLTPGQEQSKSGPTSAQDNSSRNSSLPSGPEVIPNHAINQTQKAQGNLAPKADHYPYHPSGGSAISQSRPGPTGRKRGRPRLGSPNRSTKNSERKNSASENRSHMQHQRAGYPPHSMPQNSLSSSPSQVRARLGQGPPPLDYVPPQRLPGMPPLVSPQGVVPPPMPYHQSQHHPPSSHHHPQQQQPQHAPYYNSAPPHPSSSSSAPSSSSLSSVPRSSPGSSSAPYPPTHPHHRNYHSGLPGPHHPPTGHPGHLGPPPPQPPHHASHHPSLHSQHRPGGSPPPQPIHKRYPDVSNPESKPLPLLVIADHANSAVPNSGPGSSSSSNSHHHPHHHNSSSPRYISVSHNPSPSCSCEGCVVALSSRNRSPSHHQHPHHQHQQRGPGSNLPPHQPPSSSNPPPPGHQQSSSSSSKQYVQKQDIHPSQHHPLQYYPYHQQHQNISASARRNSSGGNDPSKEALKPVIPSSSGGKQIPPQAIIPSYVVAQRPYPDSLSPGSSQPNPYSASDYPEDERNRRRSSISDPSRPLHLHSPQYPPHHPISHSRNPPNMPEDNVPSNYRQDMDRPVDLRPIDLHKPSSGYRNSQHASPAASSPASPPMDDAQPLDLSIKPSSKKSKVEDAPYQDRRMSRTEMDPRDHQTRQASYPGQTMDDNSMDRSNPYPQQIQPPYHHQNYYHHTTTSPSTKQHSPALPGPHGHDGPHQHRPSSNPEGKFYSTGHPSPSYSKHNMESTAGHPSGHSSSSSSNPPPHNSYPSSQGSNSRLSSSPTTPSLLSLPPHMRRNSSSSENSTQENRSYHNQAGSPYSESNHHSKSDMDLPAARHFQPPRNPEEGSLRSAMSTPPDSKDNNGDYASQRPPPPLMKPSGHPPPPSQQQQQQQQQQQTGAPLPPLAPPNNNSNSPDDPDSLKHVSRHEPIQNIIGNHPQNDILYLICKLCRQTYGSPYGFRKHFRNQHGFEPKVEHTIVQTISATKTAMNHNNVPEGGNFDESKLRNSEDGNSNTSPYPLDRPIKMEIPDNYSVDEFNSSQIAAYHRAQEHVKIIFKQDGTEVGSHGHLENAKVLECPECGQTFQLNDFGSYKRHCRQHSMVPWSGPFSCHDCHRSFAEPGQLEQHLNTHNTFTPSVCGICRTFFSSPHYLAEHLQAAHGHVLPSEASKSSGSKSELSSSEKQEKQSSDMPQVYQYLDLQTRIERALMMENELEIASGANNANRSSSRSPVESKSPSNNSTSSQASVPQKRSSPSLSSLPPSKRHRMSTSSPPTASMLTVVTPKKLEVQKQPADPVVSSASPDSSFDDQSKQASSTSTTNTAAFSSDSSAVKDLTVGNNSTNNTSSNGNSPIPFIKNPRDSNNTPVPSGRRSGDSNKSSAKSPSIGDMKCQTGRDNKSVSESERCTSVDSNNSDSNLSASASLTSSPGVGDDSQVFYKHKKYSRHLKRRLSGENNSSNNSGGTRKVADGAEPPKSSPNSDAKIPKLDKSSDSNKKTDASPTPDRKGDKDTKRITSTSSSSSSPSSPVTTSSSSASVVTSSVNTSVRKEDCQSSSSSSTSSSSSSSKSSQNRSSRSTKNSSRSSSPYNKDDKDGKTVDTPYAKDKSDKSKSKDDDVKKRNESKT